MTMLLDTHALVWWLGESALLSRTAERAIAAAPTLAISTITCWEVARLVADGRLTLAMDPFRWFDGVFSAHDVEAIEPSARIAVIAGSLPQDGFHGDPADSLVYATAKESDLSLVSKDRLITEFARERRDVKVIW